MEKSALIYVGLTLGTVGLALLMGNREKVPALQKKGYAYGAWTPATRRDALNAVLEFIIYSLLAAISACRFALGNDYWVYRENFRRIFYDAKVSSEIGFNLVVKALVYLFGYDNYLPLFAIFSLVTVFFFVRALHDQSENFAFSLFLLMTGGYYFQSLNTIRYYLALAIALFAMKYVLRREVGKFLIMILCAAFFHKTVLVVIPAYLLAAYLARRGMKKWQMGVAGALLASLVFGQKLYRKVIFWFYPLYENSEFDVSRISWVNMAKCLGVLALLALVWFLNRKEKGELLPVNVRFYLWLNAFGLVTFLCGVFIPEVTRIGYYFIVSQVFSLPGLIRAIRNEKLRRLCLAGVCIAFSLYFVLLLKQMYQVNIRILPYQSWIFYYK
ncbi:MAG: EpsG family protein [Lachnospiraceae bacterium]|nr:EpsG family protein [Lachnospiraceae bacterium]